MIYVKGYLSKNRTSGSFTFCASEHQQKKWDRNKTEKNSKIKNENVHVLICEKLDRLVCG